jgi:hypothetical protein
METLTKSAEYFKPLPYIFTKHLRERFSERVLQLPKKKNIEEYAENNKKSLNFEIKKRLAGSVVIDDVEVDSLLKKYLKEEYGGNSYVFYLNNNVIYVGIKQDQGPPVIVTCYKKDGVIGEFHFAELYSKYYHTGKLK